MPSLSGTASKCFKKNKGYNDNSNNNNDNSYYNNNSNKQNK